MLEEDPLFDPGVFEQLDNDARRLRVRPVRASIDDARSMYGWTAHKLDILTLYLKKYRQVAGGGTYIDAFAGTGEISVEDEPRPGSVAVASDSEAFATMHLYELPANARKLRRWIESNPLHKRVKVHSIHPGDSNVALPEDLDASLIPRSKPCFALLDPNATELAWSTVVRLANYKLPASPPVQCRIELWILFNTHHALMRMLPTKPGREPSFTTLDRWFGDRDAWWDLYLADEPAAMYAQRYAERLQGLGYGAAVPRLISDPKTNRAQYYMIHASDHPAAHDFMTWASRRAGDDGVEVLSLPGIDAPLVPKRRRRRG